jgi:putative ABC transport system permease protein
MHKFFRRLYSLFHRRRLQRELEEEMAAHREMMPAERQRYFGSTLRLREEAADQWGWTFIDQVRQDLVFGARSLRRSPGFALTAIAVLSLGIGVNLAEIQVFNALLHRLDVRDVDSLRRFYKVTREGISGNFSVPEIEFYRRQNTVLSAVIAETYVPGVFQGQDSDDMRCSLVSGNFFGDLGITPMYGRLLDEQDDQPGSPPVAVLGYGYWKSRFGGDPRIVTKTIRLNDKPVRVVGIAPAQFGGLVQQPAPVWMAIAQYPYLTGDSRGLEDFGTQRTFMLGRLKPGISLEAAEAQFRSLTGQLRKQEPLYVGRSEWLKIYAADTPPSLRPEAVLLFATCILLVLLVLLAACANLGNMLLARGLARQHEIEIRLAIGAGRWRLIRQLMTENLLLAALASAAALFVGRLAARILLRIIEAPPNLRIVTDWKIVSACAALGLGTTFAFGLAPALHSVKRGPKATAARKILVSLQVAVSCVLLILSSFLTRAIRYNFRAEVTFDYAGMAVIDPAFYLHGLSPTQTRQAALEMVTRLRQMPGIDAVSMATIPPLKRLWIEHIGGRPLYLNAVDPTYFPMMRLPVIDGRAFEPGEQDVAVVSESAARDLWPNESPIGKTCLIGGRRRTVTGVVKDSGVNLISNPESVEAYTPIEDKNAAFATILVHATSNPGPMSAALRSAATLPGFVPAVFTFQSSIDHQLDTIRKTVAVVWSLGAVASLLAMLGIFGLLAFTVAQRTREIGVRMAMGARGLDVLQCVIGRYALPFGIGAAFGVAVAAAASKVLRNILFGFLPFDLTSFGAGLLLFGAVALAASIVPARRALRIDPASALRYE